MVVEDDVGPVVELVVGRALVLVLVVCEVDVELLLDVVDDVLVLELDEDDVELVVELVDVVLVVGGGVTSANRFCASIVPRPVTMSYPGPAL